MGLILALTNYTPGTFLSGWDTLHPEFNFGLGLQREIFGVFRSEQGLGAVAAHSHMADLPHLIILYILHFALPITFLRYAYIFANLILGPIGMYFFLKKYIVKSKTGAFLGSIFYLLNLGTLQIFTVPFEMFTTQYAFLPWIFLFATNYISSKQDLKKTLFLFSLTILLAMPTAYAATLWYLFFFVFTAYLLSLSFFNWLIYYLKRSLLLIVLALGINSFWILPNIYYALNHGKEVANALINQLFSPQAFLYNKEFGNIKDIPLMKNFLFDWNVYSGNNNFSQLLAPWIIHLQQQPILLIGYVFALVSALGIFLGFAKKNKVLISLTPPLLVCFFFLFNDNPPTGFIYNLLQDKIPLSKEAFRFPGNKILGIFTFLFVVYFAKGQEIILNRFKKMKLVFSIISLALIIYYMLPAFSGNLINPHMRVQIPKYYFEMFDWFKTQPYDARIAELPINSLWGWKYYGWFQNKQPSFQGADFLQFGIPQPLLDRDFDRWSPYNEQYYREMSYAVYANNPKLFKSVLQKYNINYILLDTSIISPKDDPKSLFYPQIKDLLDSNNFAQKIKIFGNTLFIYKVKPDSQANIISNPLPVSSKSLTYYEDYIYENYGNYINREQGIFYPLANLIGERNRINPKLIRVNQSGINLNIQWGQNLNFPSLIDTESYIDAQLLIEKENNKLIANIYPVLPFKTGSQSGSTSFNFDALSGDVILSINRKNIFALNPKNNTPLFAGNVSLSTTETNIITAYSSVSKKSSFSDISKLDYSLSYCNEGKNQEIFGIEQGVSRNKFSIFGKGNPVCISIPLNQFSEEMLDDEALVELSFNYKSFVPSELCLAQNNICTISSLKYNKSNYIVIDKNNLNISSLKFSINTTSDNQIDMAVFEDFSLKILNPVSSKELMQNDLEKAANSMKANELQRSFAIPFSGDKMLGKTAIFSNTANFQSGNFNSKQLIGNQSGDYIRYTATNYSLPDHFIYQNLPQDRAYLIIVTSRNIAGLPLTLCVTNEITRHCDIYNTLSSSKNFSQDVFLLPKQLKTESGFDLNINNLGIGSMPTINDLKSIDIVPFPYQYLSQISAGNAQRINKNVFILPKSFDSGWKAYVVKDNNWITSVFPFVFGKELKEHVLVNNWANGWILNDTESKNPKFVIIFWPQYLEYLGFGILIATFVWLAISARRRSRQLPALY